MRQQATVEQALGPEAVVSVRRKAACGADCDTCKGCAHPEETIRVTAVNRAGAGPGDVVTVETQSRDILGLAALLYLMPVVLMIGGYLLAERLLSSGGEGAAIAVAFAGLILGLGVCVLVSRRMKQKGRMTFVITAVHGRNGGGAAG